MLINGFLNYTSLSKEYFWNCHSQYHNDNFMIIKLIMCIHYENFYYFCYSLTMIIKFLNNYTH